MNIQPTVAPTPTHATLSKKRNTWAIVGVVAIVGIAIGALVGAYLISRQTTLSSQASATTTYFWKGQGQSLSYDGTRVKLTDTGRQFQLKLVVYKANQPAWGPTWAAVGAPVVINNFTDGMSAEMPCGYFQADLIPQDATVYQSPSYTGDRYGSPGADVLKAAVNGERAGCSNPTSTPLPPTPTVVPTSTPTPRPTATPTPRPTDAPTPTPAPSTTPKPPTPTPTTKVPPCKTPPPVTSLKIVCPNCSVR